MSDLFISFSGNVTQDPDLRFTANNTAVVNFNVAVNRSWFNKSEEEWEEVTSFYKVIGWNQLAEHAAESLSKGQRVTVYGRIEQTFWEDEDGNKRSSFEVTADEIAVSLKYGTAEFTKAEKKDDSKKSSKSKARKPASEDPF